MDKERRKGLSIKIVAALYIVVSIIVLTTVVVCIGYHLFKKNVTEYYEKYALTVLENAYIITDEYKFGDQGAMDERVREIEQLDIHSSNEVGDLYRSISKMETEMAGQLHDIIQYNENILKMQNGLMALMADMVEIRDSNTGDHIQKTALYVKIILEGLNRKHYYRKKLTPQYMEDVFKSAPLHDVGKIKISDAILNKPGKLTDEEYEIMKTHSEMGKEIIDKAISDMEVEGYLQEARNMAAYHHERWDGKGYPLGLKGEEILLAARIMAVADVFDALTSSRVYKPTYSFKKAVKIIEEGKGTQFDPRCVEVFLDSLPEVKEVLKKLNPDFVDDEEDTENNGFS